MRTPMTANDDQDQMGNVSGDMPREDMPDETAGDYPTITLNKSDPDIAEQFANCKPGDMYRVVTDDENEITLEKTSSPDEGGDDTGDTRRPDPMADKVGSNDNPKTSDNPAIMAIIGKRVKH